MTQTSSLKIGWLGPSLSSSSHIQKFDRLVPPDVKVVYEQLILHQGKSDLIVARAVDFSQAQNLDALIFPGAPREALNPGLFAAFASALKIPVTTALRASAAALKVFGGKRSLLLTPFDAGLNQRIREFLADFGFDAVSPSEMLAHYTDALRMTAADVLDYAKRAMAEQHNIDSVYFQGAVLDPVDCLERLESDLQIPVVASNPAMLWFTLSRLGRKHQLNGYGRLLATWPEIDEA
jgi:hypothetical protein